MDFGDAIHYVKDFDGVITYLEEYRNKRGIQGDDKGHWIERVIASCYMAREKVGRELERTGEAINILQKIYDEWNNAGDDPEKLEALLAKVVQNENLNPTTFRQVRAMVEQHLERAKPLKKNEGSDAKNPFVRLTDSLTTTVSDCRKQISERLRQEIPTSQIEIIAELLCEYICNAPSSMEKLEEVALESPSRALFATVGFIGDYLENPNDLIPESRYGVWGFLDDSWLIHNTVYRLIECGIVNINNFELDWQRIAAADRIVLSLLPQSVLHQLNATMLQFLSFLDAEVSNYNPRFFSSGSNYDFFRPYDPVEEERQTAVELAISRAGSAANIWG
jgi:uncharacterized membrane protein YkvA (DUF1232 family)